MIAANGIETPRLLLMSRNQIANGVANSSGMVGRNLMDHPQYLSWGLLPDPVFPYRGPLVTSAIGDLCDGPFRSQRAAFRISLGNEAWTATVGGSGGDPQVTTLDFINGMNFSGLNKKDFTQLADDNRALFGADLTRTLGNLISRQFRIAFPIEQNPDPNNRVTLSSVKDALNLPRPRISYDISDYTKQGIVAAFHMKELIFRKLGAIDFTKVAESDPAGSTRRRGKGCLTYGGAGHVMGTYRMGDDPKTSVVDLLQCSHDHPNLYLVGSGTFPTVGTANPTLTLSALRYGQQKALSRISRRRRKSISSEGLWGFGLHERRFVEYYNKREADGWVGRTSRTGAQPNLGERSGARGTCPQARQRQEQAFLAVGGGRRGWRHLRTSSWGTAATDFETNLLGRGLAEPRRLAKFGGMPPLVEEKIFVERSFPRARPGFRGDWGNFIPAWKGVYEKHSQIPVDR